MVFNQEPVSMNISGQSRLLDVRRSIGYIFSPINRVSQFKKDVKFELVQDSCDRLPCVIASSLKPLSSCHKQCNHILAWCACWKYVSWEKPFCYTFYNVHHSFFFYLFCIFVSRRPLRLTQCYLGVRSPYMNHHW